MREGYVYVLTNRRNGKVYVGQTTQRFEARLSQHSRCKTLIGVALRKYGKENFSYFENEVPEELMDNLERNLITLYNCHSPDGYNLDSGGNKRKHLSAETRTKMSVSKRGSCHPLFGKHLPNEYRMKLSAANKGRSTSEATRAKLSNANRGRPVSRATRMKLSESLKDYFRSQG